MLDDTIAAIATPPGDGGIGIIRISGPGSVALAEKFFRPVSGGALSRTPPRTLVQGLWLEPEGGTADSLLCARFQAPASFTGEDVVEVQAHGGAFHLQALLSGLLKAGARLAGPGEFTRRAFLNGKMDLTQAEAVADLIASRSHLARQSAAGQLKGGLHEKIESFRLEARDLCAQVEASLDFPAEEAQLAPRAVWMSKVGSLRRDMQALLATARTGRLLRRGLRVVFTGRPNVGKSSLLNALLGSRRAIVSEKAGTTRDFLEEPFQVEGFPMLLVDTAGLRQADEDAERQGVERGEEQVGNADVALLVLDASRPLEEADRALLAELPAKLPEGAAFLVLKNKSDLSDQSDLSDSSSTLKVSALSGAGLPELKTRLLQAALGGRDLKLGEAAVTQVRHEEALRRAEVALGLVESTLKQGRLGPEFMAGDLRDCLDALGEIVGATSRQEVLDAIFSKFCIGK